MRAWRRILGLLIVVGVVFGYMKLRGKKGATASDAPAGSSSAGANRPVPVVLGAAESKDTPIYLQGLGTVTAFYTVTVKSQVDGRLDRVLFKEGQVVSRGDVLVKLDPLPFEAQLRVNQAQLAKDIASLDNAKVDLQRYEELLKADSTSTQVRDTARSLVAELTAAVANDAAQVDLARLSLSYTTIRAPITGRVGARLIDAGNIVHTADANGLVVITQLSPIAVSFAVPQERLKDLRAAQAHGSIPVTVLNDAGVPSENAGEVILIDNQIDTTTGTIHCKAQFSNASDTLWPGQFVTVRVALKNLPDAILIPTIAVQNGSEGPYVYVVTPDNRAQARVVHIGSVEGDQTIVGSGLSAGETAVTEGQFRLQPNALVHIISVDSPRASLP